MPILSNAASKIGLSGAQSLMATNTLSATLESVIKELPKKDLLNTLKDRDLTLTKKHVFIPTTSITLKFNK